MGRLQSHIELKAEIARLQSELDEASDELQRVHVELQAALTVVCEAEWIKAEAHVKGDHFTYDLMRTVLRKA
jgi:hypothetical protein